VALLILLLVIFLWATTPRAAPGQLLVQSKTPFTQGPYFVFSQPWGGETTMLTRPFVRFADATLLNVKAFPRDTVMMWRWPPAAPSNGPGVWGYDQISYGNYDGGEPEQTVPPIRVKALTALSQRFRWSLSNRFGDGNVLTEFYLRSSPTDVNAKTLEIGWFLHAPESTRGFFESSKPVGTYQDGQGRRWTVRISDKFCMFAPERAGDIPSGSLDMLAALRWLTEKKLVTGEEYLWGLAIGVEPVRGTGRLTVHDWQVERR
jgi:hypothetical protein